MDYSVAIRTLGRAGHKYQTLLDSLENQTIKPKEIFVYIAEGYPIPEETIGIEKYVYVKKGMAAQRALNYDEIKTDYILFLDDDLRLDPETVEKMFAAMLLNGLDVIAPDIFRNSDRKFVNGAMMMLSARMRPRYLDDGKGYKVMRSAGYSYRMHILNDVYPSETNAGAAFLCKKKDFLRINFQDELWLDHVQYALGDDQVMFYKMHKNGLKVGTWYNHTFIHLDAGDNLNPEKERNLIYSDFRFKTIFWHRFVYTPESQFYNKLLDFFAIGYAFIFTLLISVVRLRFDILSVKLSAMRDGVRFIQSDEYKNLPKI